MAEPTYVEQLRMIELDRALGMIPGRHRILEIGAGHGWQARRMTHLGHEVEAVDIPDGDYASERIWPIRNYDGVNLPYPSGSFDVVFSSNVLEHVANLEALLQEANRVIRLGGCLVHVVPSASWRFWTTVTYYPALLRRLFLGETTLFGEGPRRPTTDRASARSREQGLLLRRLGRALSPPRHGLLGTAWSELWHFRRGRWIRRISNADFEYVKRARGGIFYSGSVLFGLHLSFTMRRWLSYALGSSTHVLVCRKRVSAGRSEESD